MAIKYLYTIWFFTIALSIFRYFEEDFCISCLKRGRKIISFIIGAMIPIIFLELLNDVYSGLHEINDLLALFLPGGFIAAFLIERHIYSHLHKKRKMKELHEIYISISSIFAFFLGIIFGTTFESNLYREILLLITFFLFHIMSSVYIHHIDDQETRIHTKGFSKKILYAASPIYGYGLTLIFNIPTTISIILFAIFTGAFMHLIFDDLLREEKETDPKYFMLGAIIFIALFIISNIN